MPRAAQIKAVRLRADKDGCLSGPAFSGALTAIWKESRERPEQQVTLLLLDIDNLHQLNTVHGREGGDTVGLTPAEDMVLKSSYYSSAQLARLKALAERKKTKEAVLLREGLEDVLRKYDRD